MKPLVLYHDNCNDGFCSAFVAWRRLGDEADYRAVQYGQAPPDVKDREVYILDFSYPRPLMLSLVADARSLVVLDHHKTAQEELAGDWCVVRGDRTTHAPTIIFDMEKSGCHLAWNFFFPGADTPWLVDYVEDRDLWRWKLPDSQAVNATIASYPKDFLLWESWLERHAEYRHGGERRNRFATEGAAILRFQQQQVNALYALATEVLLDGHRVLSVNTPVLVSEVAGHLAMDRPFGVCWFENPDGKIVYSLRSRDGGIDVSEIARKHGGGGHRNAAGFTSSAKLL